LPFELICLQLLNILSCLKIEIYESEEAEKRRLKLEQEQHSLSEPLPLERNQSDARSSDFVVNYKPT